MRRSQRVTNVERDSPDVAPACTPWITWSRQRLEYGSMAFSVAFHVSILLTMAYCALPRTTARNSQSNVLIATGDEDLSNELLFTDDVLAEVSVECPSSFPISEVTREMPEVDFASIELDLPTTMDTQRPTSSKMLPTTPAVSLYLATSVEKAFAHIASDTHGTVQDRDLLIVWLLDASQSMAVDRECLAAQLETFFLRLANEEEACHQVLNAVVSFGAATKELVAPTELRAPVLHSIRNLPEDASGKENVFEAIEQYVSKYRRKWPDRRLMLVVWTDESGDDVQKLENTIEECRQHGVSVSVVGPSAVLGADMGLQAFIDPRSQQVRQVQVTRGPDTAVPERLELGYWYLTQEPPTEFGTGQGFRKTDLPSWYGIANQSDPSHPGHQCIAALEVPLPSWYGGRDLQGLVSGFGPYGLTRLALETGGTYIIFDRKDDGGPFLPETMWAYRPEYLSMEEYVKGVQAHPLRQSVMEAVNLLKDRNVGPPPTVLFGQQSKSPPYGFMRTYFTPAGFVKYYRRMRLGLKSRADHTTRIVEEALACVSKSGAVDNGLEHEYQRETSPRWRAWYDLTRGRLLATSVRLEEYRLTCDAVLEPGFLGPTTNNLIFVPSLKMRSESGFRRRAEEAERLLTRCVRDNPNTPWALLAQRELDYSLGIGVRQQTLMHVVMPPSPTQQARLPNL